MAPNHFSIVYTTYPQCPVVPIRQRGVVRALSGGGIKCYIQDPRVVHYLGVMYRRASGYPLTECARFISGTHDADSLACNEERGKYIFNSFGGQPGAAYPINFMSGDLHHVTRPDGSTVKLQCLKTQIPVEGLANKKLSTPFASDINEAVSSFEDDSIEDYEFEDVDCTKTQPKLRRHSDYEATLNPCRFQMVNYKKERALTINNNTGAEEPEKDSISTCSSSVTLNNPDFDALIAASKHRCVCHKTKSNTKHCPYQCKAKLPVGTEVKPSQDEKSTSKFNDPLLKDTTITGSIPSLDAAASFNLCVPYLTMTFGAVSGAGLFSWEQSPETVCWATIIPVTLLWTTVLCTLGLPLSMLMVDEIKDLQGEVKRCNKESEHMLYAKNESTTLKYDIHDETLAKEYKRRMRSGGGKSLLDMEKSGRKCRCIKCNTRTRRLAIYCTIFLPSIFAMIAFILSMVSLFALMFVTENHTTAIRATAVCIPATVAFIVAMGLILHRRWSTTSCEY